MEYVIIDLKRRKIYLYGLGQKFKREGPLDIMPHNKTGYDMTAISKTAA